MAGNTTTQKLSSGNGQHKISYTEMIGTHMAKTRNWRSRTLFPNCKRDKEMNREMKVQTKNRVKMYSGIRHRAMAFLRDTSLT